MVRRQRFAPDEHVELDAPGQWLHRRVWLLLLLTAAQRAGLTPMPGWQVHRLAFLANCLSPVYDVPMLKDRVLKYRRGPFYPDLQWDLDRLAIQGLAEIQHIRHEEDDAGWWFFADYAVSLDGIAAADEAVERSPWAAEMQAYLIEVAGAYEELSAPAREDAALKDANYSDPGVLQDHEVMFAEVQANFSVRTTEAFQSYVGKAPPLSRRDRLYLYFRYLDRVVEKAAG